jgi:hypothetical protein
METVPNTASIIRKIAIVTLIGFAAVVLSGPLIAAVAALLPFAIVGALIYLFIKAIILGPYVVGKIIGETFRGIGFVIVGLPLRILRKAGRGIGFVLHTGWAAVAFAFSIAMPAVLGSVAGALLGVVGGIEHSDVEMRVPAGIVIGAAVGAVAGLLLRHKPARKPVVLRAHPEIPQTVVPA